MGVATAIIGSAILGAGASMMGASKQAKAAKQGAAAQTDAANKQIELQKEIYYDQRGLQQPYYQAGLQGLYGQSGVMDLLGKGGGGQQQQQQQPMGNALAPANQNYASGNYGASPIGQPAPQSGPNYAGYVSGSPDIQTAFQGLTPEMQRGIKTLGYDKNNDGQIDAGEYGAFHYAKHGQGEGRQLPQYQPAAQPTGNALAQGTGQVGTAQPVDLGAQPAATPAAPTEGPMTQSLRQTPGYMFLQDESKRQIENSFAQRGKLLSGSAMNALNDRTLGIADQTYGAAVDRNFQLANLGMGAAAQITNAGTNYGIGAGNALANIGNAQANGAYGQANAFNAGMQGVGNAIAGGIGAYGSFKGWGAGSGTPAASTGTYNGVF